MYLRYTGANLATCHTDIQYPDHSPAMTTAENVLRYRKATVYTTAKATIMAMEAIIISLDIQTLLGPATVMAAGLKGAASFLLTTTLAPYRSNSPSISRTKADAEYSTASLAKNQNKLVTFRQSTPHPNTSNTHMKRG